MFEGLLSYTLLLIPLILARVLISSTVAQVYRSVASHLDRVIPDNLMLDTGAWLEDQLETRGLYDIRLVVTEGEGTGNAFWPGAKLIHLDSLTYHKRDPAFWAIGAHELGHALLRRRMPVLSPVWSLGRLWAIPASLGTSFLLAAVLFATPDLLDVAWWCIVVGLGLELIVLVDEAIASVMAMGMLRADGQLTRRQLGAARWRLLAAWGTYVGSFVGSSLTLAVWSLFVDLVAERQPIETVALSGFWGVVAYLLGGALLVRAGWVLFRVVVPPSFSPTWSVDDDQDEEELKREAAMSYKSVRGMADGFFRAVLVLLLWLIWDVHGDFTWALLLGLAVDSVTGWILAPALLLVLVPVILFVQWLTRDLRSEAEEERKRELELARDPIASSSRLAEGSVAMESAQIEHLTRPPLMLRLARLREIAYVPAVVYLFATV